MLFEVRYVSLVFHSSTGSSKKDASMLRRLINYQESGSIKDARVVLVLRTGNTGFPNVPPCLFIEEDGGLCSHTFKMDCTAFVFFVIHVYVPWWFTCSSAISLMLQLAIYDYSRNFLRTKR